MRFSRKILLIVVLAILVIGGTLGGVAIANADDQSTTTTTTTTTTTQNQDQVQNKLSELLDKVATIYQQNTGVAIDSQELAKAFSQAEQAIRSDKLDTYLDNLVKNGKLTQEQADQLKNWWDSKPDVPLNIPMLGGGPRAGKIGRFGGMYRGWCLPDNSTTTTTTN
jgi:hypothetical protein